MDTFSMDAAAQAACDQADELLKHLGHRLLSEDSYALLGLVDSTTPLDDQEPFVSNPVAAASIATLGGRIAGLARDIGALGFDFLVAGGADLKAPLTPPSGKVN